MRINDSKDDAHSRLLSDIEKAPLIDEVHLKNYRTTSSDKLSPQEVRVVTAMSFGMNLVNISEILGISYLTAMDHSKAIRFKLRAKNQAHCVAVALRQGIIR